jgi:hypothetical protein
MEEHILSSHFSIKGGKITFALTLRDVAIQIKSWQQAGLLQPARGAFWTLGISALIIVLPVELAIVLPQNPAL